MLACEGNYCLFDRILCITPRLVRIAVIEFFDEKGDVFLNLLHVLLFHLENSFIKGGKILALQLLLCHGEKLTVVLYAEAGLRGAFLSEIHVRHEESDGVIKHVVEISFYSLADIAGLGEL